MCRNVQLADAAQLLAERAAQVNSQSSIRLLAALSIRRQAASGRACDVGSHHPWPVIPPVTGAAVAVGSNRKGFPMPTFLLHCIQVTVGPGATGVSRPTHVVYAIIENRANAF